MEAAGIPAGAAALFGDRLDLAIRFHDLLADQGVLRGLIGPREVPRLWDRHLLNCAVLTELVGPGERVIDVGSGAGLPGLVLAIARPDLDVVLVEPMRRRVTWLEYASAELGLTGVRVVHARAEACWDTLTAPVVTARAVAPLRDLATWCLPLLTPGGRLLAMKGSSAADELARDQDALDALGVASADVVELGAGLVTEPTWVVRARLPVEAVAIRARTGSAAGWSRAGSAGGSAAARKLSRPRRPRDHRR